jgi:hypothetical protein
MVYVVSVRRLVPSAVIQSLVVALTVLKRLDYGNAAQAGLPSYLHRRLQSILVGHRPIHRSDLFTDTLASFHCLPATKRTQFKLANIVYRSLHSTALGYLLLNPENMDTAVGILFLPIYKMRSNYFRFRGRHLVLLTSGLVARHRDFFHWVAGSRKHGCSRWNFVSISSTSWDLSISGFCGRHVVFPTSGSVAQHRDCFHWVAGPRKHRVAVGISFLSHLQAEMLGGGIQPLPIVTYVAKKT